MVNVDVVLLKDISRKYIALIWEKTVFDNIKKSEEFFTTKGNLFHWVSDC